MARAHAIIARLGVGYHRINVLYRYLAIAGESVCVAKIRANITAKMLNLNRLIWQLLLFDEKDWMCGQVAANLPQLFRAHNLARLLQVVNYLGMVDRHYRSTSVWICTSIYSLHTI